MTAVIALVASVVLLAYWRVAVSLVLFAVLALLLLGLAAALELTHQFGPQGSDQVVPTTVMLQSEVTSPSPIV